jgi:CheY-like chemotaxis protein
MNTRNDLEIITTDFSVLHPLRILVAEDNLINQKLISKVLFKIGYVADVVENGVQVLEALKKINYDLILMDIQMPEMDGIETTRVIRMSGKPLPVIAAMTSSSSSIDIDSCLEAGMNDYLDKPVFLEGLMVFLKKWFPGDSHKK